MKLIDFLKVITGLGIGVLATGSVFGIGHAFIEAVLSEEKPDVAIIVMSVLVWFVVSYNVLTWMF
mgnify:CR=1 FL=1